ncbi:unnamed protein product [Lupinus luteus]|uniref:Uncharacterized protein n=1 Tax=Lupinus luteus TaxID=3873 RepID=A0AAV1XM28_LUPLU
MADSTQVLPAANPVCERIYEHFPYCLGLLVGDPNFAHGEGADTIIGPLKSRSSSLYVSHLSQLSHL